MGGRLLELTAAQRSNLQENIKAIVTDAAINQRVLRIAEVATDLAETHRYCGLELSQIADELSAAAVNAGVSVELSRPKRPPNLMKRGQAGAMAP